MTDKVMLFNPYTGTPRHPSDIQSDPQGILVVDPEATMLRAAPKAQPVAQPDLSRLEPFVGGLGKAILRELQEAQQPVAQPAYDEAALIAKGWRLQDCKVCGESASAYVSPPAPDCRTCLYNKHPENCADWCTLGDRYQPAPKVVLWRTT
jgi:hypothetical protein